MSISPKVRPLKATYVGLLFSITAALSACDLDVGDSNSAGQASAPPATFAIGGTLSGLTASENLVLLDNNSDALTVSANGSFTFSGAFAVGAGYAITVGTQPALQKCIVTSGTGTVQASNVTNVSVQCTSDTFSVGGSIAGLSTGQSVQLLDNGTDRFAASADGSFAFPTALAAGSAYTVSVASQPPAEHCSVSNGQGTVSNSPITSVTVTCTPNLQMIGGTITGLTAGQSVQLTDDGGAQLTVSANGPFTFATSLPSGASYAIAIKTQPAAENCTVANASGLVGTSNISNVAVTCVARKEFALVSNNSDNTLSVYTVDPSTFAFGNVAGSPFAEVGTVGSPQAVAVSPQCPFAYVANNGDSNVSAFLLDQSTGVLTAIAGSPFASGLYPQGIAISPDCSRLYVTNNGDATLSGYSIDMSTGALTPLAGSPYTLGMATPYGVTFDATGHQLYVADEFDNALFGFSLDPATGAPAALVNSPYPAGNSPRYPQIHPNGLFLYVANAVSGSVSAYAISPSTGALSAISGSPFPAGAGPFNVSIHPGGLLAYVPNVSDNTISGYAIDPSTGELSALTGSPFSDPGLNQPIFLAVNPTGTVAAVVEFGGNSIVTFAINASTGNLTSTGASVATGAGPASIAISP